MGFFISAAGWLTFAVLLLVASLLVKRGRGDARVVLRLSLDQRRTVYVVDIAGRHLVLGGSDGALTMLTELDDRAARSLVSEPAAPFWKRA